MKWELFKGTRPEDLGFFPSFIKEENPEDAVKQINAAYQHGGGWNDFKGFTLSPDRRKIYYPGDPPMNLLARTKLRDEEVLMFEAAWVAVVQKDGTYRIARID